MVKQKKVAFESKKEYKIRPEIQKATDYHVDMKPFPLPPHTNLVGRLVLYFMPMFLAFGGVVYLKVYTTYIPEGLLLSPAETGPLALAILIFMIGYAVFLGIMFSDQIKSAWMEIRRKWLH